MGILELVVIAVALAADAFAVALAQGTRMRRPTWRETARVAVLFGLFQALMPLAGWALSTWFADAVSGVAPWIACGMLAFVGAHMVKEGLQHEAEHAVEHVEGPADDRVTVVAGAGTPGQAAAVATLAPPVTRRPRVAYRVLLPLAIATSIDAAASGVTFAVLGVPILPAVVLVGVVTLVLSGLGVRLGARAGERLGRWATVAGGAVLILLGLRILL
ncbi:putative Mn2+ efflux pump MntP [Cellulosimicrobium cellulans]|uniref:manganese efflux pump MntP n=1 Tax=Cellulosimicrobium cellulans TaxID=1710 RepID=UPI00195A7255|nr:manganese efflux pump MntP family protein [Cellulosimicrobium cellulans]MBM7820926.1 putative Mn2+ efflux pump MntP [Cellulosimicrobium cellulans]